MKSANRLLALSSLALVLLATSANPLRANGTTTLTSYFDNHFDERFIPEADADEIFGTGTLSFSGPALDDGLYSWGDFSDLSVTINFVDEPSLLFTEADIVTPTTNFLVGVYEGSFYFAGDPVLEFGASSQWTNSAGSSFYTGPTGGYVTYLLEPAGFPVTISGNYGAQGLSAVPEPSTYAAIAGGLMFGFVLWRRRRAAAPTAV
ncbi:PEP-CTERM sorting domain-containing protein [Actomonas aquatica]|uniref:PEP-CTERM sorting domain-containing protein n=1 Tax=Actomonas aquatica TaxID=2866162 RepID=A0ABZ1C415_9BACT|nr:PEP-CTERM sorting domain-containing protein [Opitutus sp. WL0086]WRQ86458.1 PEP-CTERM sorting domain-containing protein [Opitutus sp. WL0086]